MAFSAAENGGADRPQGESGPAADLIAATSADSGGAPTPWTGPSSGAAPLLEAILGVDLGAVIAIVPAHDEAPRVAAVVRGLIEQGLPVLVVDDGSTDGTGDVAREAGARVLRLEPNQGKGAALKAGFRLALGESPDAGPGAPAAAPLAAAVSSTSAVAPATAARWNAILTLDGDGQHDPVEVPSFLRVWGESGADLVVGARDYGQMPPVRWFTNTASRHLFSWALGETIRDNQSGYRLHSRRLAETVLASPEQGFAFEVEEIAICVGRGYKLAWVPIQTIYGTEKSDIKPWSHFVSFLRVTRRARRRMREERGRVPT